MKKSCFGVSLVLIVIVTLHAMQVESSSRTLVDLHDRMIKHSTASSSRLMIGRPKIAEAYSVQVNSGTGHAIMHNVVPNHSTASFEGFKVTRAYSGPSRGGIGHGLTNLLRKNPNSTPFKMFNQAHSGPNDRGTGH